MTTVSIRLQRLAYVVAGLAIALAFAAAAFVGSSASHAPQVLAQCHNTDVEDSFSMSCVPASVPFSGDQLTEAEVAEPGWNAYPHHGNDRGHHGGGPHGGGGGGGGGGHGGH